MIPTLEATLAAQAFLARREGLSRQPNILIFAEALREAQSLAGSAVRDEPAALFVAFARRPKALVGTWRTLPALLAANHALRLGLRLRAGVGVADVQALRLNVATRAASSEDVRRWFAERLVPLQPK